MNTTNPTDIVITGTDSPDIQASSRHAIVFREVHASPLDHDRLPVEPLGIQLRRAREALGLSCMDVAQKLKLPHTVIESLEAERFEHIGYGIYLRGYLDKYLNLLGLPGTLANRVLDEHSALPPLVTTRALSRPRYLFERYSGSALYLILTGVIIVPSVLLAMHAGITHNNARIAPLNRPLAAVGAPIATPAKHIGQPLPSTTTVSAQPATPAAPAKPKEQPPLAASMAPFNTANAKTDNARPETKPPAAIPVTETKPVTTAHDLHLQLVKPSWVEVVEGGGQQLEYALLPAGSVRDYHSDKSLEVLLGNADGASVRIDGKPYDLSPYLHGNVARFKLAQGDWSISPSGG